MFSKRLLWIVWLKINWHRKVRRSKYSARKKEHVSQSLQTADRPQTVSERYIPQLFARFYHSASNLWTAGRTTLGQCRRSITRKEPHCDDLVGKHAEQLAFFGSARRDRNRQTGPEWRKKEERVACSRTLHPIEQPVSFCTLQIAIETNYGKSKRALINPSKHSFHRIVFALSLSFIADY